MADEQNPATATDAVTRKRPKPGERRIQILQALAAMLELPGAERVTTAALAARLGVSEAALYRHFASTAQMFEGLIDFIETSIFSLLNQITEGPHSTQDKLRRMLTVLLQFAERNPGMVRVMVGDALVFENDRLQQRMNLFFDKVEAGLRQVLREATADSSTPTIDAQVKASLALSFVLGRLQRFARSGYKRSPLEHLDASLAVII